MFKIDILQTYHGIFQAKYKNLNKLKTQLLNKKIANNMILIFLFESS